MTAAPLAAFKDICLDAADAERAARFWAAALGLRVGERRGSVIRLDGPGPRYTVWVNAVPEPRTVKNRLHLDVHTRSVAELEALGAAVLDDTLPWTVMADPDGGEFCAFVRAEPPPLRLYEIVLDAHDPAAAAAWWARLLGGRLDQDGDGWGIGDVPGAPFAWFCVNPTADPKAAKNRVHVDVRTDDLDAVLAHGARLLRPQGGDIAWHVLADPEGNEFCAFTR
jgi:catechol 2,3-dioxygenase-like lactoylglutathione lyase family enzyme